jgi:catalase
LFAASISPTTLCCRDVSFLTSIPNSTVTGVPTSSNFPSTDPYPLFTTTTEMELARTSSTRTPPLVSIYLIHSENGGLTPVDTPNTLNKGYPKQANQTQGKGFFTAPGRKASGNLSRSRASTFADHWSQPRLFYNSLTKVEQQLLINAIRFETSNLKSETVKKNVLYQLNKISHDIAVRVAKVLGLEAPEADDTYYHDNTTAGVSTMGKKLPTIATLTVGVLVSTNSKNSIEQAKAIKKALAEDKVTATIVGEFLGDDVEITYDGADAVQFDGIVVASGTESLFNGTRKSTFYPPGRPAQIIVDGYNWGKPVGFVGSAKSAAQAARIGNGEGVYLSKDVDAVVKNLKDGLATFKFTDRFPLDD